MIKNGKTQPKSADTEKEPVKITDISEPRALPHIKKGGMAVDALKQGLINAYEMALFNSPAGISYYLVNVFAQEGLDVFVGAQQIDTLIDNGILEGVAAINKLRKHVPEFLEQVAKSREFLQERDVSHAARLCNEVINFANRGSNAPSGVSNIYESLGLAGSSAYTNYFTETTAQGGFNDVFWSSALTEIYTSNLLAKVRYMKDPEKWPNPDAPPAPPVPQASSPQVNDNALIRLTPLEKSGKEERNPTPEELVYGVTAGELIEKMTKSRETSLLLALFADELYARRYSGYNEEQQLCDDIERIGSDSFESMLELARMHDRDGSIWVSRLENMKVDELTDLMICHYKALGYFVNVGNKWRGKMPSQDYRSVFKSKLALEAFPFMATALWASFLRIDEPTSRGMWD